jgi:hypothetical protein
MRTLKNLLTLAAWCLLALAACADDKNSETVQGVAPLAAKTTTGEQVQGVWLFQHSAPGGDKALLRGDLKIVNGCLLVGDEVVVWHEAQVERVRAVVQAVLGGTRYSVVVSGGGIRLDESGEAQSLPIDFEQRCLVKAVWFANSQGLELAPE